MSAARPATLGPRPVEPKPVAMPAGGMSVARAAAAANAAQAAQAAASAPPGKAAGSAQAGGAASSSAGQAAAGGLSELDRAALELVEASKQPTTSVRLDGLALTKIVKHSRDAHPSPAAGALLGLELGGALEVSNVFALPPSALTGNAASSSKERGQTEEEAAAAAAAAAEASVGRSIGKYSTSMLSLLKEVNADANLVGLYYGCFLGHFLTQAVVDGLWAVSTLMEREGTEEKGRAVLLVHDLAQSAQGNTSIRAFKLSPNFVEAYRKGKFNTQTLVDHKLTFSNILVEIPVTLHNTALLDALLASLSTPAPAEASIFAPTTASLLSAHAQPSAAGSSSGPSLAAGTSAYAASTNLSYALSPVLSTSLESTLDALDEYASEAGNVGYQLRQLGRERQRAEAYLSRKRAENAAREQQGLAPLPVENVERLFKLGNEPSRLEGLLLLAQLDETAHKLQETAAVGAAQLNAVRTGAA